MEQAKTSHLPNIMAASQTTDPVSSKKKSPAKKKKVYIISGICLVLVIAVLTAFFCLSGYTEETSEQLFLSV